MNTITRTAVTAVAVLAGGILTATPADADHQPRHREVVVHVVDHTDGTWPVKPAMRAWSKMRGLRFKSATDCADTRRFCVVVDAYDHRDSGWMGLTTHLTQRIAHIQLNVTPTYAAWSGTRAQRRAIVCHELAHTLGVPHPDPTSTPTWGCIAGSDHDHSTPKPTRADRAMVRQVMAQPWSAWGAFRYAWQTGRVG